MESFKLSWWLYRGLLKTTCEAWKSNFRGLSWTFWPKCKNMGSWFAKEWHLEPRRRVRRTEPLPKMNALQYTPPKATSRDCGNCEQGPPQSACPAHAGNLAGPEAEGNKFFREVTVAWAQAYGQGHSLVSLQQVQHWPCGRSPSIQSRSPLGVPCHCSAFTQPNICIHSLAATAADIPLS